MVKTDGTSDEVDQISQRSIDRYNENRMATTRINFYIDQAEQRLNTIQDKNAQEDLRWLITFGQKALDYLKSKDVDGLLQAFDQMHKYREKCNLPFYGQKERAKGKKEKYGPVRKILTWLDMNYPENSDIFEEWRKTRKIIATGNGEKWSLFAYRIDETIDTLGNVKPEDYEYFYADRSGEDPEDDEVQINEIPVTVGSIKTALSRI